MKLPHPLSFPKPGPRPPAPWGPAGGAANGVPAFLTRSTCDLLHKSPTSLDLPFLHEIVDRAVLSSPEIREPLL